MNEKPLFTDIQHTRRFEIHILSNSHDTVQFDLIANLVHPSTIDMGAARYQE